MLEDTELGIRLAKAGAHFDLSDDAYAIHATENAPVTKWMERWKKDGMYASRVAKKHPGVVDANPWRHFGRLHVATRPLLAFAALVPGASGPLASATMHAAKVADGAGLDRVALVGAQLLYAIQFYRGVGEESGGPTRTLAEFREFRRAARLVASQGDSAGPAGRAAYAAFAHAVRQDHRMLHATQAKYGGKDGSSSFASDAIQNVGLQMMIGVRLMGMLRAAGFGLAAKACSRAMRHLYASDIHFDAEFEPGVVLVHGFGLAICGAARIGSGCILFQHVTLGIGRERGGDRSGGPRLESNVHDGVGATLTGPITIGAGTKIMAGCTLVESVPAGSLVEAPAPRVRPRS
jgi:serine acetyltransferase